MPHNGDGRRREDPDMQGSPAVEVPSLRELALTPRWIAGFLLAVVVAASFGFLAKWQWSRSHSAPPPPASVTDQVKPLSSVFKPGRELLGSQVDHIVEAKGVFDADKQVLVAHRLQSGTPGWWVVAPLRVSGGDHVIPVVRGWTQEPEIPGGVPSGEVTVVGRLLPPEAPVAGPAKEPREEAVESLAPSELANLWDAPAYDAFIVSNASVPDPPPEGLERVVVGAQPQTTAISWLNVFYALEWMAFAGVAFFVWFRLLQEARNRHLDELDAAQPEAPRPDNTEGPTA
ncbi:SURF1 family protein [Falsarthrobacter nasiphocae]|uniref:SURF1-like protein n=1 Tax=Falsarthrobacter nasiphocae TaxID=189863 RepID=A0AAE3YHV3_9MICC|nr:SURF1 family protein [Falsarthrobacter nasiphocae]MDR6892572.1 cytochrome oxidase assembly protein ShyY1 [Falsarthrobacter nasiphocae]